MRRRKTGNYGRVVYSEKSGPKEIKIKCFVSKMQDYARKAGLIPKSYLIGSNFDISIFSMRFPGWILQRKVKRKISNKADTSKKANKPCECCFSYNLDYFILKCYFHNREL